VLLLARAGTGKSTTIEEAVRQVPAGKKSAVFSFGREIATAMKDRLAKAGLKDVEATTTHSYGMRQLGRHLGGKKLIVDNDKVIGLAKELVTEARCVERGKCRLEGNRMVADDETRWEWIRGLKKAVGLAKGCLAKDVATVDVLLDRHDIETTARDDEKLGEDEARREFCRDVLHLVNKSTKLAVEQLVIDYDDMVYLPVALNARLWQYDMVFVDETQDLNAAQIELTLRACKRQGGRIFAVGDPAQSIMKFRGADEHAVDNVKERLRTKVMPLSVTYRCAKAIVREAQTIVSDYEWAPSSPEGKVERNVEWEKMKAEVAVGDFILSRTNAPLVALCLEFLRAGRRANIQGRDMGGMLSGFVKKQHAKTVPELVERLELWAKSEIERLSKKDADTSGVEDKVATLLAVAEGAQSVQEVLSRLEALFSDDKSEGQIVLSSTHRAKGLERDRVWLLFDTYKHMRGNIEEDNLYYVAVTRAKRELYLVVQAKREGGPKSGKGKASSKVSTLPAPDSLKEDVVLDAEGSRAVLDAIRNSPAPTDALQELMSGGPDAEGGPAMFVRWTDASGIARQRAVDTMSEGLDMVESLAKQGLVGVVRSTTKGTK
jgi:superfamily I DNA/RNA helicase